MKNIIIGIILAVSAINANAITAVQTASKSKVDISTEVDITNTGIITPNIATGVIHTSRLAYITTGEIVVCPSFYEGRRVNYSWGSDDCTDTKTKENRWVYPKDAIPKGKTYVGFKSYVRQGSHVLDIYWK